MYGVDYDNPWLTSAEASRRRPAVWIAGAIGLAVAGAFLAMFRLTAPSLAAALMAAMSALPDGWPLALSGSLLEVVVFATLLAVALLGLRLARRSAAAAEDAPAATAAIRPSRAGRTAAWLTAGLVIGAAGFCASALIAGAFGGISRSAATGIAPLAGSAVLGLAVVALQAFSEEIFFRAWLQPILCVRLGPWLGLAATSALFAGLHLIAGAAGALAALNMFLGGLVFGLLALRSGGIAAAWGAHFAWNWTESGAMGLEPTATGGLAGFRLDGPPIWGGGPEHMNASVATTLVLLAIAGALILVGALRRRA
ncbi:MAG TPA: CPBP family intramembrane glutamic endopeptidase [Caulobacteraceae bacterium]|jgi:hypothetical protein|nr:CPBP family intramembrane glutamic endopeptidase [Caulobacteraceae bacterium]